jgi:DNA-binding response OmpR family regulator
MSDPGTTNRILGLRILAVDDEPDILETIVDVLEGATVDCARSYQEAMSLLNLDETGIMYDFAILDIMGVDGMELLAETTKRKLPTVMLTAHAMNPETLRASMSGGALSYLPKEELANLDVHIGDVLEALERGQSTWERLFDRIGSFFERAFAPGWRKDDPEFWRAYYGPVM